MRKIIFIHGAIAGAVIVASILVGLALDSESEHLAGLEWLGYLIMVAAFSLVFFGIKQYRDQELGGVINFLAAVQVGLGITLVASVVYVLAWEASLAATDYAFIHDYTAARIEASRAAGASVEEMAALAAEMEAMKAAYAKPLNRMFMTFLEIFPVGLLITLLSAALLRRSNVLPANA